MSRTAAHAAPALTHCANCGRLLEGSYCASCGQKATALNPGLHDVLHDFTHELLHVDGKIFQSVRLLLTRPGFLTREYFEGRRARYISPIRLYLIFSVAFFAAVALGPQFTPFDVQETAELRELAGVGPDEIIRRMWAWAPRTMFVLVPVFALLVAAVTRSAGRNYPQDLYFALHVHAALFAVLALGNVVKQWDNNWVQGFVDLSATAYVVWYVLVAFRTAYGGSWRRAVARAAVVGVTYLFVVMFAIAVVSLGAVLGGAKNVGAG